jgi:hypothetical protein
MISNMHREPVQLDYSTPVAEQAHPEAKPPISRIARAASLCAAGWFFGVVCWWIAWFSFDAKGVARAILFVLGNLPVIGVAVSIAALIRIGTSSGTRRGTPQATAALVFNLLWLGVVVLSVLVLHMLPDWNGIRG